jgi:hypothetical protein
MDDKGHKSRLKRRHFLTGGALASMAMLSGHDPSTREYPSPSAAAGDAAYDRFVEAVDAVVTEFVEKSDNGGGKLLALGLMHQGVQIKFRAPQPDCPGECWYAPSCLPQHRTEMPSLLRMYEAYVELRRHRMTLSEEQQSALPLAPAPEELLNFGQRRLHALYKDRDMNITYSSWQLAQEIILAVFRPSLPVTMERNLVLHEGKPYVMPFTKTEIDTTIKVPLTVIIEPAPRGFAADIQTAAHVTR